MCLMFDICHYSKIQHNLIWWLSIIIVIIIKGNCRWMWSVEAYILMVNRISSVAAGRSCDWCCRCLIYSPKNNKRTWKKVHKQQQVECKQSTFVLRILWMCVSVSLRNDRSKWRGVRTALFYFANETSSGNDENPTRCNLIFTKQKTFV